MARSYGRHTRAYKRNRQAMLAASNLCHICHHSGARTADHVPSLKTLLRLGLDPAALKYLRPAHGTGNACPTCGRLCNQLKGADDDFVLKDEPTQVRSREW